MRIATRAGAQPGRVPVGPAATSLAPKAAAPERTVEQAGEHAAPEDEKVMRKAAGFDFARLPIASCAAADEQLARAGRDTQGCPYIERAIGYYAARSAAQLERAIRKFAPGAGGTRSAGELIPLVSARMARGVRSWVETGQIP